jgi:CsoR family transcriptional regulator, copper-sensing transcriptional repressor
MMAARKGFSMAGYSMSRDDYLKRLRRIEGQVRGLQRMVSDDRYCIDILTQVSSVTRALQGVAVGLLDEHVRHCVMEAAAQGDDSKVEEATAAIERLIRS